MRLGENINVLVYEIYFKLLESEEIPLNISSDINVKLVSFKFNGKSILGLCYSYTKTSPVWF